MSIKQPDYMKRFAFIAIITVFLSFILLASFQDSIKTMGGGFALAALPVLAFAFVTWYAVKHCGDFTYFAIRIAVVLDILLLIFLIAMLVHAHQEIELQQSKTLLLHLPRSGITA